MVGQHQNQTPVIENFIRVQTRPPRASGSISKNVKQCLANSPQNWGGERRLTVECFQGHQRYRYTIKFFREDNEFHGRAFLSLEGQFDERWHGREVESVR
jgi:hypothetical protein